MNISSLLNKVAVEIVNPLLAILFVVALIVFLWGIFELIRSADNDEARRKGQQHILWGIIGMFIMVAANAIVTVIQDTVGGI